MKIFYFLTLSLVATAIYAVDNITEFKAMELVGTNCTTCPELKFVAKEDGKYFFADATRRTWEATSRFCESMGMKLASITSAMQWSTLRASYSSTNFTGYFWTAGRDALALRQFSWNATEEPLSTTYLVFKIQQS